MRCGFWSAEIQCWIRPHNANCRRIQWFPLRWKYGTSREANLLFFLFVVLSKHAIRQCLCAKKNTHTHICNWQSQRYIFLSCREAGLKVNKHFDCPICVCILRKIEMQQVFNYIHIHIQRTSQQVNYPPNWRKKNTCFVWTGATLAYSVNAHKYVGQIECNAVERSK